MWDKTIKPMPKILRRIVMASFLGALICLAILFININYYDQEENREDFLALMFLMVIFISSPMLIIGGWIFLRNIKTFKSDGTSVGLNRYGNNSIDYGLGYYLFNQLLALIILGAGLFLIFAPLYGILMHAQS